MPPQPSVLVPWKLRAQGFPYRSVWGVVRILMHKCDANRTVGLSSCRYLGCPVLSYLNISPTGDVSLPHKVAGMPWWCKMDVSTCRWQATLPTRCLQCEHVHSEHNADVAIHIPPPPNRIWPLLFFDKYNIYPARLEVRNLIWVRLGPSGDKSRFFSPGMCWCWCQSYKNGSSSM